jgi:hypothetical protein
MLSAIHLRNMLLFRLKLFDLKFVLLVLGLHLLFLNHNWLIVILTTVNLVISRPRSLLSPRYRSSLVHEILCSWSRDLCQKSWSCSRDLFSRSWLGLGLEAKVLALNFQD